MTKRIAIIGSGGVGKTTLAAAIETIKLIDSKAIVYEIDNPADKEIFKHTAEYLLTPTPLLPEIMFNPPLTRAERREQKRLNNKKSK